LADFQPKVPQDYKNAEIVIGNLHPLVQSSVLDQMETQPKLVVLDTMNFLDGLCFARIDGCDKTCRCNYHQ
jgi:hypothetical protein